MDTKTKPPYFAETLLGEFDFKNFLFKLNHQKWLILIITACTFLIGEFYVHNIRPRYVSTALIQIGSQLGSGNNIQQMLGNMGVSITAEGQVSPADIEIALIKSSFILQSVADKLKLNITVSPQYFPIIGVAIAQSHRKNQLAKPFLGLSEYAWGGEQVQLEHFETNGQDEGINFRLQADGKNQYSLYSLNDDLLLRGTVGKMASSPDGMMPQIKMLITNLKANPGTHFTVSLRYNENVLQDLAHNIGIVDLGTKTKTGVLKLSFQGSDPKFIPQILDTIIDYAIQRSIEKKSAEASKTLEFLKKQLPSVRKSLDNAETDLYEYRAKSGSIDMSQEAKIILMQLSTLEQNIAELKLKKVEMLQELKPKHPIILGLNEKQSQLEKQVNSLRLKIKSLPKTDQTALSLERDVNVKTQLYLLLLSKIQQLQVLKAGTLSDIRILNRATTPIMPLPTYKFFILLCSLIIGLFLSVMIIIVRDMLKQGVEDVESVEEKLGIDTFAIIPFSMKQKQFNRELKRKLNKKAKFILAAEAPKDIAIEGIRSLRTILEFTLTQANNNIISIMGASPNIGKSFISLNLAQVLADSGKSVLLIDCDMRKGKLNQYLARKNSPGFAELLSYKKNLEDIVVNVGERFDFIPSGEYPKNPSEMLLSHQLKEFLAKFSRSYDIVIIDTPPVLAVTDAIIISKWAGTNLMVIGCGSDQLKELELMVKRVKKNGIVIDGLVFNNKVLTRQVYGQHNYYYAYETQNN